MASHKNLILGGGMVSGYCAKEYVEKGGRAGEIAIVSAEPAVPYESPPLSKSFLAGKDKEEAVFINNSHFYIDPGIDLKLNTRITAIDAGANRLRTASGEELTFEKLIISFSVWWLSPQTLVAAFVMNRPDEESEVAPETIPSKRTVSAERLRDTSSIRDALS